MHGNYPQFFLKMHSSKTSFVGGFDAIETQNDAGTLNEIFGSLGLKEQAKSNAVATGEMEQKPKSCSIWSGKMEDEPHNKPGTMMIGQVGQSTHKVDADAPTPKNHGLDLPVEEEDKPSLIDITHVALGVLAVSVALIVVCYQAWLKMS